jgi:hypothetical protein
MTAVIRKGHKKVDLTRMPTLMPVIYALVIFFQVPVTILPSISSVTILAEIASNMASKPSSIPKVKCPDIKIRVMNKGGTYRMFIRSFSLIIVL